MTVHPSDEEYYRTVVRCWIARCESCGYETIQINVTLAYISKSKLYQCCTIHYFLAAKTQRKWCRGPVQVGAPWTCQETRGLHLGAWSETRIGWSKLQQWLVTLPNLEHFQTKFSCQSQHFVISDNKCKANFRFSWISVYIQTMSYLLTNFFFYKANGRLYE